MSGKKSIDVPAELTIPLFDYLELVNAFFHQEMHFDDAACIQRFRADCAAASTLRKALEALVEGAA